MIKEHLETDSKSHIFKPIPANNNCYKHYRLSVTIQNQMPVLKVFKILDLKLIL